MFLRRAPKRHPSSRLVHPSSKIPLPNTSNYPSGKYKAEQFDPVIASFRSNPDLKISVTVDEIFAHDHRVVNTLASSEGRFTFTAAESGDHRICFMPSHMSTGGWLSSGQPVGGIKLSLDLAIGETSAIESTDKSKLSDIAQKVQDLNARLQDIRREQVFQRVRPLTISTFLGILPLHPLLTPSPLHISLSHYLNPESS